MNPEDYKESLLKLMQSGQIPSGWFEKMIGPYLNAMGGDGMSTMGGGGMVQHPVTLSPVETTEDRERRLKTEANILINKVKVSIGYAVKTALIESFPFLKGADAVNVSASDGKYIVETIIPVKDDMYDSVLWKIVKQAGAMNSTSGVQVTCIEFLTRKVDENGKIHYSEVPHSKIEPATAREMDAETYVKYLKGVKEEMNHYPELVFNVDFQVKSSQYQ